MTTVKYSVPNISCGHCVHTIKVEVSELPGVESVEASQDTKEVTITFGEPATEEKILTLMSDINYPAVTE
ncbi:MAG: heavy-metal-associated domain-containing protein [Anaerolineales bacterium]|jgi:copper chaperone CopZ